MKKSHCTLAVKSRYQNQNRPLFLDDTGWLEKAAQECHVFSADTGDYCRGAAPQSHATHLWHPAMAQASVLVLFLTY